MGWWWLVLPGWVVASVVAAAAWSIARRSGWGGPR